MEGGCHRLGEHGRNRERDWRSPGFAQDDRHPVVCVSWHDAKAYAAWLSSTTGKPYRLLSEAEREFVARAGSTAPFWWGRTISTRQANYDGRIAYAGGPPGEWRNSTVAVDTFPANPWGLHNVHGNVWEWTEDCWNESYNGAPADGSARTSGNCGERVLRGGCWINYPFALRSAAHFGGNSGGRDEVIGFRIARTLLCSLSFDTAARKQRNATSASGQERTSAKCFCGDSPKFFQVFDRSSLT
jgi:formylglycine-generating enzyme required for sulfatase activity